MITEILNQRTENAKIYRTGKKTRKAIIHNAPIHYLDRAENRYKDINLSFKSLPDKFLIHENKVTYGGRKDRQVYKYVGLRYDKNRQLEITMRSIKIDGIEKLSSGYFLEVNQTDNNILRHRLTSNLNILSRQSRSNFQNFLQVNNKISEFVIKEQIHLKGMYVANYYENSEYVPDINGRFNIKDSLTDELLYSIHKPKIKDKNGVQTDWTGHKLEVSNNELIYTKYSTQETRAILESESLYPLLIDADTFYGDTDDTMMYNLFKSTWSQARDVDTCSINTTIGEQFQGAAAGNLSGSPAVYRPALAFDTSALTGSVVTAASLFVKSTSRAESSVIALPGTFNLPAVSGDFRAFIDEPLSASPVTWVGNSYNEFVFQASRLGRVNTEGHTKIMLREYDHDYLDDYSSGYALFENSIFYADTTGTTSDPYMEIEYSAPTTFKPKNIII